MSLNFSASVVSEQTILGRMLRLPLKLIPADMPMPVMQGPMRGKRWVAGSCNHGCWLGSYEHHTQKTLAKIMQPGYTVYDLGANVGYYTLLASTIVGPAGKVFSFEPVPRNLAYLRRHLHLNNVTNCTILEVAVGASEGVGNFDLGHNHFSGHLTTNGVCDNTLTVRIVGLDQLHASGQLPPPNVIKCDIEGAEHEALTGAMQIIATHRPTIVLATHGPEVHQLCHDLLTAHSYTISQLEYYGADRQLLATPT